MKRILWIAPIIILLIVGAIYFIPPKNKDSNCSEISDRFERESCYMQEIELGVLNQNPEKCEKYDDEKVKDKCYLEISSEIRDPEKCEKIPEGNHRNSCYISVASYTKDIKYCEFVIGEQKYSCSSVVGKATNNVSLCEDNSCVLTVAIGTKNKKLCENMKDLDLYFYEERTGDYAYRDFCLSEYARSVGNEEACELIAGNQERNMCYRELAIRVQDITICQKIDNYCGLFGEEIICDDDERVVSGQIIMSGGFLNQTEQFKDNNCYQLIANSNPLECDKVRSDSIKLMNLCYYSISLQKNDPSICENIEIPNDTQVTCQDYLNYYGLVATPRRL